MICTPHPILLSEKFKKKGMVGAYGTSGQKKDVYRVLCGNMKGGDHLKYLGVCWRKYIEISFGEIKRGLDWNGPTQDTDRNRALASMVKNLRVP
jgi:hypothetical protein